MVRAVVRDGAIVTLDPLPTDWGDGDELVIDRMPQTPHQADDDLDQWETEMEALAAMIPVNDFLVLDQVLAEADEQAKAIVRRDMGL